MPKSGHLVTNSSGSFEVKELPNLVNSNSSSSTSNITSLGEVPNYNYPGTYQQPWGQNQPSTFINNDSWRISSLEAEIESLKKQIKEITNPLILLIKIPNSWRPNHIQKNIFLIRRELERSNIQPIFIGSDIDEIEISKIFNTTPEVDSIIKDVTNFLDEFFDIDNSKAEFLNGDGYGDLDVAKESYPESEDTEEELPF